MELPRCGSSSQAASDCRCAAEMVAERLAKSGHQFGFEGAAPTR
jgi:hypothetical protein